MTVTAETKQLNVDAAGSGNAFFIRSALGVQIFRGAVGHVSARDVDVDMPEKIFLHKIPIRLSVVCRQADVFVEVERGHAAEIESFVTMEPDQLLIKP